MSPSRLRGSFSDRQRLLSMESTHLCTSMQLVIYITTGDYWWIWSPCNADDCVALLIYSFASVLSSLTRNFGDPTSSPNNWRPVAIILPSQQTQPLHQPDLWLRYSGEHGNPALALRTCLKELMAPWHQARIRNHLIAGSPGHD